MFSLFSNEKKEELSMLIDIQSGLVRGALVLNKANQLPHILYVVTRSFIRKTGENNEYLTKMMLNNVAEVANLLGNEGVARAQTLGYSKKSLNSVHYILSSPWIISKSKLVKIEYEKETQITKKLVQDIVNEEHDKLKLQFKNEHLDEKFKFDLVFIEQKIFEIKLNGYTVNNYEGRNAKVLEISFATSLSSEDILKKVHSEVQRNIHANKTYHHSALLLHFIALQTLFNKRNEFSSIHIHGELTDIILVKNGLCVQLASFPFGISTLIRKISAISKQTYETSDSLLGLYQNNKLESAEYEKMKKIIDPLLQSWYTEFMKSISNNDNKMIMPGLIYLSAHNYFDIFKSVLEINNTNKFEITPLNNSEIESHIVYERTSEKSQLMGMYALALKNMI